MASPRLPRRLLAVLYADVAGYTALTSEDEDATHGRLSEYLDLIAELVAHYRGQVVHYAGDAVLATFESVEEALRCATRVQGALAQRNASLPEHRCIHFRIGINLGDVIHDRGDVYGDGVNIAARLESLAEPGGICVSESVQAAAPTGLPIRFEPMGRRRVKNVTLRVYRVAPSDASAAEPAEARAETPGEVPAGTTATPVSDAGAWKRREGTVTFVADAFRAARAALPELRGRDRELKKMARHLEALDGGSRMVFLHGPLGVGKTDLAVRWWQDFSAQRRHRIPYLLIFDCAALEGQHLTLDIGRLLFDVTRDFLERNHGRLVEQIVAVARASELVLVLDNLERLQAPASAGEFRDYIRGDAGRLLQSLVAEGSRARIVACSQRFAPQLDWDASGRILAVEVPPLDEGAGAEVVRDIVSTRRGRIDERDARRLAERERGLPLNLVSAALAYARHGEISQLDSAVWRADRFDDNLQRYAAGLSPSALAVLRIVSLSEEGLAYATLVAVLEAVLEIERAIVTDGADSAELIERAVLECEPLVTVSRGPDERDGAVYQIAHTQFRNFFRAGWERSPGAAPSARRAHRLLARIAWFRAERGRDPKHVPAGFEALAAVDYPADPHPYGGSLRALRRYVQCLHHALASVDPAATGARAQLGPEPLGRERAGEALAPEADAELVVRFALDVVYLTMIERGSQWYLSRGLGADDTRLDLLARFFRPGASTIDLGEGVLPGAERAEAGPPLALLPPLLPPKRQGELLFWLGIAAHRLGEWRLAEPALDGAFAHRRHHQDFAGAVKVLTTIADLQLQTGRIAEWLDRCSYYLWEFARWDPEAPPETLEGLDEEAGRERARIIAELLGRHACARLLGLGADEALPDFRRAEAMKARLDTGRGFLDGNVGRRYRQALLRVGERDAAEARNRQAGEHHRGKRHEMALLAMDRAGIYRARGRLEHARLALGEAEELTRSSAIGRVVLYEHRLEQARLEIAYGNAAASLAPLREVHWRASTRSLALIETDALLLLAEASPEREREEHLERAADAIERTGYAYRRPDLETLRAGESAVARFCV